MTDKVERYSEHADWQRVRGTLEMTESLQFDGLLHAAVVRAQVPHGHIRGVDTAEAAAQEGVVAVLTGGDVHALPGSGHFGDAVDDQPILAWDRVRYVGEPVALVIAADAVTARNAATLVHVDIEESVAVLDIIAAAAEDAPIIDTRYAGNCLREWRIVHGDVDGVAERADHIFDDTYVSPPAGHVPLEAHAAVATWRDDVLEVWSSTQSPYIVRGTLAKTFELSPEQVRVHVPYVGGAFGSKVNTTIEPLVAAATLVVGRPVALRLSRAEAFVTSSKHAAVVRIRTGVQADGRILFRDIDINWNAGAYTTNSISASGYGLVRAPGPYVVDHVRVRSAAYLTNTVPAGPFRGAMTSQLCWAYESQMDDIAARLSLDPLELRRINLLRDGDVYPTGEVMHDLHYDQILDAIVTGLDDMEKPQVEEGHVRGRGVCLMIKSTQTPSESRCILRRNLDGTYDLRVASVDMGQGGHATMQMIAAEALGVERHCVRISEVDTQFAPFDSLTASSRSTFSMGSAIEDAARRLKEADSGTVEVEGYWSGAGGLGALDENGQGPATTHWHQGGAGCEVDVDTRTGRVTLVAVFGAAYAGRVVSESRARHQNEGGMIFALGPALFEELIYSDGQLTNPNLSDYLIPSINDVPTAIGSAALEGGPDSERHGLGEMTVPPIAPAIGNGLWAACGVRIHELPIKAEKVYRELRKRSS